MSQYYH